MKIYNLILFLSIATVSLFSQENKVDNNSYTPNEDALYYLSRLDSVNLKTTLFILASDEYEGRGTAEPGGKKTQEYVANYFKKKGISAGNGDSYFQNIEMYFREGKNKQFILNDSTFYDNFDYSNKVANVSSISDNEILFVGYGFNSPTFNDFENINITRKTIMLFDGMPTDRYGTPFDIDTTQKYVPFSYYLSDYIINKQPKAIIRVRPGMGKVNSYYRSSQRLILNDEKPGKDDIPTITVNESLANRLLESTNKTVKQMMYEIERDRTSQTYVLPTPFTVKGEFKYEDAEVNNVIGFIEGTDLRNEYIIVSAHHDHVGIIDSLIHNGADDNASGVSSLLEIARIMQEAKKEGKAPRRSIIFFSPTAEELGLLGSNYYTSHPIYPLDSTVANINLDMLGRTSYQYSQQKNNYVYVVNDKLKSGDLTKWADSINASTVRLTLDYEYSSPEDPRALFNFSDNYSFARKGIPSISFSSGEHKDYHRPTDDEEFINYNALLERTKLAFLVIWELANSDNKPIRNNNFKSFDFEE